MMDIYTTCLVVGILLLIISVSMSFLDGLDGIIDGALHIFNVSADISFLPLSGTGICGGMAIFGAVGRMTDNLVISVICGYIFAVIVQTVLRKLKKVDSRTLDKNDLFMYTGKIVSPIINGKGGCVLFQTLKGTQVKYPCKLESTTAKIEVGTSVKLIRFDENNAIVEVIKDELEEKYQDEA